MALIFTDHFIYGGGSYDVFYDTSSNSGVVNYTGPGTAQTFIAIPNAGRAYTEGQLFRSFCSDNPSTTKVKCYATAATPFVIFTLEENSADCEVTPGGCDLAVNSLVVTPEQSTSANDGKVLVNASSSAGGIQYSLDGVTYQSGNEFINLAPGNYTVYLKDAADCTLSQPFTILPYSNPVQNFTDGLPVVDVPTGNVSKWNAAFNPIVVNYQRKDYTVVTVTQESTTQIKVTFPAPLTFEEYTNGINGGIYLKTPLYSFYGKPDSYSPNYYIITTPYLGDDTGGFLNIIGLKPNFFVQTEITSGNNPVVKDVLIAEHSPNKQGATKADLAPYLQTLLSPVETYDYLLTNYKDANLAGSYTLRYREVWDGGNSAWFSAPYPLYYTYAAMQLGERYGGNMAQYVPFMSVLSNQYKAKFLTGFGSPKFFAGNPYEISFILSEDVVNENLYIELVPDCGVTSNGLLLNADATYLLNADLSRFIIEQTYNPNIQGYPIIAALGVNRVLIPDVFDCCAENIIANIYYIQGGVNKYIMQPLLIRHECQCNDPFIYLKWINHLGAWDYWRFGYNQRQSQATFDGEQINRFVDNWETDQTIEDYISRNANKSLELVAGQLDQQELNGLTELQRSIKVQMLVGTNPYKWQTVIIDDGDFNLGETRKGKGNVKFAIKLPAINIQRQ